TRSKRDWSSDVCSSDLGVLVIGHGVFLHVGGAARSGRDGRADGASCPERAGRCWPVGAGRSILPRSVSGRGGRPGGARAQGVRGRVPPSPAAARSRCSPVGWVPKGTSKTAWKTPPPSGGTRP